MMGNKESIKVKEKEMGLFVEIFVYLNFQILTRLRPWILSGKFTLYLLPFSKWELGFKDQREPEAGV